MMSKKTHGVKPCLSRKVARQEPKGRPLLPEGQTCFSKFSGRNFVKIFGIIALVAIIGFTVVACGGGGGNLNGSYADEYNTTTYTFADGKITMKGFGMTLNGTYKIKGSNIIANFDGLGEETIKYTLQGDTLTLVSDGETTVLKKK